MGEALAGPLVQPTASGAVLVAAIVQWEHQRGGQAHCLGRLFVGPAERPVGVLSELRSNPDGLGITSDAAAAATVLVHLATRADALSLSSPAEAGAVWLLHHGPFSAYDNPDAPETFTLAEGMHWDGSRYSDDIRSHQLLAAAEAEFLLAGTSLEPVDEVVARLGWRP